ncbi:MAG: hypothetical protein QOG35_733 [Solirubrobacteraceae bacterium]|jgi:O-antigen ligase|nr:hypothetical protein [Solirubrobacteraceae bacterium]
MAATGTAVARATRPGPPAWSRVRWGLAIAAVAGVAGLALGEALGSLATPSIAVIAAGGLALLALLALALGRYEATVLLGVALMGVVKVEPAPTDAILTLAIVVALVSGRFDFARVHRGMATVVGALLGLSALSMLEAIDDARGYQFLSITVYLGLFGLWFSTYVTSERRARAVLHAYIGAATLTALIGVVALVAPVPGRAALLYGGCCRAEGLLKDPNVFGPFLIPAAVILLEELMAPRLLLGRRTPKLLALGTLVLGVLVSYSRAAWLNLAVAVVVLIVLHVLRRGGARAVVNLLLVIALLAGTAGTFLVATGSETFLRDRAAVQSYDTERFATQRAGIRLAGQHPIGIGPGQFELREPISAHSTYVRVLAEQGALGFLTLIAFLLGTLAIAARNAAAGRSTYGIGSAALLAAWVGLLANSFFIDTLHWRHLWLVAALVWAGAVRRHRSTAP